MPLQDANPTPSFGGFGIRNGWVRRSIQLVEVAGGRVGSLMHHSNDLTNSLIEPIHDRMPVILTEGAYDIWLDTESKGLSDLKEILIPYPPQWMATHEVAPLVNKVQNDGPELIQPQVGPSSSS